MNSITIRRGRPEDAEHFSQLLIYTAPVLFPTLFGSTVKDVMRNLFRHRRHYFSFDRSYFIEVDGKTAGMAQLHKKKPGRREKTRLAFLLMKYLNWRLPTKVTNLLKSEKIMWLATGNDCYLSNIAVYPEYRSQGLGKKLLEAVEEEVRSIGKRRIVLKAETYNNRAISFYEKMGYKIEQKLPVYRIKNKHFESFNIAKAIAN